MCVFNQLIGKQDSLHFAPFVKYVCFPHFKNMEPGSRIDFTYPITAIVGPNGTNKSSILRALQGASAGNDVGKYWFETALDPIEMQEYGRQRYYYGYSLPSGSVAEVLQTRVNRVGRSEDYFETDDPRPNDGMKPMPEYEARAEYGQDDDGYYRGKTRWKKVQKKSYILILGKNFQHMISIPALIGAGRRCLRWVRVCLLGKRNIFAVIPVV